MPRAFALLVAAMALLVVPSAWAEVQTQCEEILVSLPPAEVEPEGDLCDGSIVVENSGEVPICLLEGASAVAPRPVHEVDGTRIEAANKTCKWLEAADEITAPQEGNTSHGPSKALGDAWVAEPFASAPPPIADETLRATMTRDGSVDIRCRIDRPPQR